MSTNHPLICENAILAALDAVFCSMAFPAPNSAAGEFMYMPGGMQTITPSQGGAPVTVQVLVNRESAAALEAQRQTLAASGKKPYFDFNHEDRQASFWPEEFVWRDAPAPGVYARGEWSGSGKSGVEAKDWRQFSPVFFVDNVRAKPAKIVCRADARPNMGALVNDPAFHAILPFWAKAAGAQSSNHQNNQEIMTPEELAALQAKIKGLETEVQALTAKSATDANAKQELTAKEAELRAAKAEQQVADLTAKNTALAAAAKDRAEKDADAAIAAAVAKGIIPAKDDALKAKWKALIVADPGNAELLAAQAANPALSTRITTSPNTPGNPGTVQITEESFVAALNAFDAEKDSRKRGALYAKDISPRIAKGMDMPLSAANSPGTLAGTLVSQRTLELLKWSFPILTRITTDFSDMPAQFGQTVMTRIIGIPSVQSYDPVNGWAKSDVTATDVPVVINNHKGVPITFDSNTLGSTVRRLFDEFAPAQSYALALNMVQALFGLITEANFPAAIVTVALAAFARSNVIDLGTALTLAKNPLIGRSLELFTSYFGAVKKDQAIVTLAAFQEKQIIEQGVLPQIEGFDVIDAPYLPDNGIHLTGFAHTKSALCLATRLPNDYTSVLPGASFGNVQTVTDVDMGISVQQVQYVNHDLGSATQRIALMYGVAPGQGAAGQILTSA